MLKHYQERVVSELQEFFTDLDAARLMYESTSSFQSLGSYLRLAFSNPKYIQFPDQPMTGVGQLYPRVCIKMPTGGGKTLIAIETIRAYQNLFAKRKTGMVVWITHRDQIYRQTMEHLQDKTHVYRQFLDQVSGNRTLILEKGQPIRRQDVEDNLVILMLMIQSAQRDTNKIFEDSGGYMDFFPGENMYEEHKEFIEAIPNLDRVEDALFERMQVKTSLGNIIRTLKPLIIVDELHTMFTDNAKATLDGLNPSVIIGLSATPKRGMNIISSVTGRELKEEEMIKLDMHLIPSSRHGDWEAMLSNVKQKRDELEQKAITLEQNNGVYIRPIALIQVERTGKDQRGQGFVHSEDVRELLLSFDVPQHEIAVKSSSLDEIKEQKLLSKESEIRYIITKEALKEGWDCSFAYILGVIPNAHNNMSMTQLVGRILRQPYAKKTGISDLDESYVFFTSGHTQEVLERVENGFKDEGLGDVMQNIEVRDHGGSSVNPSRVVGIKKEIRKRYPESLVLPMWLMNIGQTYRRFSYEIDIQPHIDWQAISLDGWFEQITPTIGGRRAMQREIMVNLEGEIGTREVESNDSFRFDELYLTRRISDTVDNAFIAQEIAHKVINKLSKRIKHEILDKDAGYIARDLEICLEAYKRGQEKRIFDSLIANKKLVLTVSDDLDIGFTMPEKDFVTNAMRAAYQSNLYEDVDISSLNPLEHEVVRIIEGSSNVIWWARNKAVKDWYAVQGWQRNKIRPDFIIARKNSSDELEFVYVIESKGEQLIGNRDTQYKDEVFQMINAMRGKIEKLRFRTTTLKLNDKFEFELIPQREEERRMRMKLN